MTIVEGTKIIQIDCPSCGIGLKPHIFRYCPRCGAELPIEFQPVIIKPNKKRTRRRKKR